MNNLQELTAKIEEYELVLAQIQEISLDSMPYEWRQFPELYRYVLNLIQRITKCGREAKLAIADDDIFRAALFLRAQIETFSILYYFSNFFSVRDFDQKKCR